MATTTEYTGVLTQVDEAGNKYKLYPEVKTDKTLSTPEKPADASVVGAKISELEESSGAVTNLIGSYDDLMANTVEGNLADALAIKEGFTNVNDSLQNENNESFNFGYLNGVRGFFTNPSRADDSFIPFSDIDVADAHVIAEDMCNTNQLLTLSKSVVTTTRYTIITTAKGGSGLGYSNDIITCTDNNAVINNVVANPIMSGYDSQVHHFVWLVEAKIGSTITVSIPKNEYASTCELHIIAI